MSRPFAQLTDLLQARRRAHELKDRVDGQCAAQLRLEGRCLKTWQNHQIIPREINLFF